MSDTPGTDALESLKDWLKAEPGRDRTLTRGRALAAINLLEREFAEARRALAEARDGLEIASHALYNQFEPDNQSSAYQKVLAALRASADCVGVLNGVLNIQKKRENNNDKT